MQNKVPGEGAESGGFAATVVVEKSMSTGLLELEVPDTIIGAVLGHKARTLGEIQQHSGCKVQVHKRLSTETTAGTRLISLTGDDDSIRQGREMIERVINEEQARRTAGGMPHPKSY